MSVRLIGLVLASLISICAFANEEFSGEQLQGMVLSSGDIPDDLQPKPKAIPKKLPTKRGPAAFSAGYRIISNKCPVYRHPNPMSPRIGTLAKGTRIWLEGVDTDWTRGFRRRKSIYVPSDCLK